MRSRPHPAIPAMIAVGLLAAGGFLLYRSNRLVHTATRATARVVANEAEESYDHQRQERHVAYYPVVVFRDAAEREHRVRTEAGSSVQLYGVGDEVQVLYDPADPGKARLHSIQSLWLLPSGLLLLGLIFLAATVAVLRGGGRETGGGSIE